MPNAEIQIKCISLANNMNIYFRHFVKKKKKKQF